jgi:alkaline phosphatase
LLGLLTLLAGAMAWAGPKNVFVLIGDGMGPDEVWAAGAYKYGNDYHKFGGTKRLSMETLANHYFVTSYPISGSYDPTWTTRTRAGAVIQANDLEYAWDRSTDSAAAGTAMSCGQKTYYGAVCMVAVKETGADGKVREVKKPLVNIQQMAQAAGMKTGIVTTMTMCNATPATFMAHAPSRADYEVITHEALTASKVDVIMGAGNPEMAPESIPGRPDLGPKQVKYLYIPEKDWAGAKDGSLGYTLVQTRAEFQSLITKPVQGRVLGAFRDHSILTQRMADNRAADPALPTLAEMTRGTLAVLENPKGFFMMMEGGAIDERGHVCDLDGNIGETLGFDEAVQATFDWVAAHGGWEENLVIITADHETGYLHDIKSNGAGKLPEATWGTDGGKAGHTNRLVDLWVQGAGADEFAKHAKDVDDFERGKTRIVDNTDIFKVLKAAVVK